MDMLLLFMIFSSATPFLLWSRRKSWALAQIPLAVGMWGFAAIYVTGGSVGALLYALLAVCFYGNLIYTECAFIRYCIDLGNEWKKKRVY